MVGKLHVDCVTTTGARDFLKSVLTCTGVMVLRDGTLTLQATVGPAIPTTTGAVTGRDRCLRQRPRRLRVQGDRAHLG